MYGDLGKVKELLQTDEIDNRDNVRHELSHPVSLYLHFLL